MSPRVFPNLLRFVVPLFVSLSLAACGGGGGKKTGSGGNNGGGGGSGAGKNLTLSLSTSAVEFSGGLPSGTPAPHLLTGTVSGTGSGTLYVLISSSNTAVATVGTVSMGSTSASADILPAEVSTLSPGQHTANITVRACVNSPTCSSNEINGSPKTVSITYRVNGSQSSVESLTYNIGNSFEAADLQRAFSLRSYPATGWTATTDVPLLTVSPTSGGTALETAVSATIDPGAIDSMAGGAYTGTIRFTPNAVGLKPFDVPVTLNVNRTRVNFVAPSVAVAGQAHEIIIRGEYFDLAPPTGVTIGGSADPVTSWTLVSDTEIRVEHQALEAGEQLVRVVNSVDASRMTVPLHVIEAGEMPAAALEYPDGPGAYVFDLIHDARRRALLVQLFYNESGFETNQLVRYAYASGSWQQTGRVMLPYRSAIALSADGEAIFVAHSGTDRFTVEERDPVSLAVTRTTLADSSYHEGFSMAVANDGNAIIQANSHMGSSVFMEMLYSPRRGTVQPMIWPGGRATMPPMYQPSGATAGSGDGSVVLIAETQNQQTMRYRSGDLETEWFDPTFEVHAYFVQLVMNRQGTLMVSAWDGVRDSNFTLLGRLPNSTQLIGISPDLPIAYTFDEDGTLRRYNLATSVGDDYYEPDPLALTPIADPEVLEGTAPIVIAPDSLTAFIAGRARIVVQPL